MSFKNRLLQLVGCGCLALSAVSSAYPPDMGSGLIKEAVRLHQPSNAQRLDALLQILDEGRLEYHLQRVPNSGSRKLDNRDYGTNVIVSIGQGEPAILVGAHFDAARIADGSLSAGMVDNAASVIVLVRVAQALSRSPLSRRVDFVFFDLEELGLIGSKYYVAQLEPGSVYAMINLDVINGGDAIIYGPAPRGASTAVHATMRRVCADQENACISFEHFPTSDDRSFQRAGIANVSFAVVPRTDAHQLWLMLNAAKMSGLAAGFIPKTLATIHTANDQMEGISEDAMRRAGRLIWGMLVELAQEKVRSTQH